MRNFNDLGLIDPILKSIKEEQYTVPTPIQAKTIPLILKGADILGCAQTGTGKTAAFAIPLLQKINQMPGRERHAGISGLVVTPTRELAIQIEERFSAYGKYTGLKSTVIFGGVGQNQQVRDLKRGVDILVATPGRLLDLNAQGLLSLEHVRYFVLDEADRMLDMGFIHDIKKLLTLLPAKRQSLFFSATLPPDIVKLSATILHEPEHIAVTPVSTAAEMVRQYVYFVDKGNKIKLLTNLLGEHKSSSVLVFTRTKHGADKVVRLLQKSRISAEAIHGNKSQLARQRALNGFREKKVRVLVATDIAARGIDVEDLELVINYDLSNIAETYVHRIGRTGRAGASGTAISFCDAEEKAYLRDVEKLLSRKIDVIDNHPFPLIDLNPVKPVQQVRSKGNSKTITDSRQKGFVRGALQTERIPGGQRHGGYRAGVR